SPRRSRVATGARRRCMGATAPVADPLGEGLDAVGAARVRQDGVPESGDGTLLSPERDLRRALPRRSRRHSRSQRRWRRRSGSRASSGRPCGLSSRSHWRM
ncbi:unnamed protein product, partial [Ectocarpus fasciculatus]